MVDFPSKAFDEFGGGPREQRLAAATFVASTRGPLAQRLVLLVVHPVQLRREPVLEAAVVVVGDQEVADPVDAAAPKVPARKRKVPHVGRLEALDEVLLHSPGGGDEDVDHLVLHQESDHLSLAAGDLVGRVSQEETGPDALADSRILEGWVLVGAGDVLGVGEAPLPHLADLFHRLGQIGRLESGGQKGPDERVDGIGLRREIVAPAAGCIRRQRS